MMAFFRVPPFSIRKTASASPPSAWPVQETPRPYVFMPPSKVPLTTCAFLYVTEPLEEGIGIDARLSRVKPAGVEAAGPAAMGAAKAATAAMMVNFMLKVSVVASVVVNESVRRDWCELLNEQCAQLISIADRPG
jgi:hypothetical protein